jgi:hypothetical protein
MFSFGVKEQAIFSSPLPFIGIFIVEIALIWMGYFCARKLLRNARTVALAGWVVAILGGAELVLPVSFLSTSIQHVRRAAVLNQIEQVATSVEPLASDQAGGRFALTYTLRFPKAGHYLTFPAYMGPPNNRVFGDYSTKMHPEYYDENYIFDGGKPYSFTVVFDTEGRWLDFSKEKANIDICDSKDYFMSCRIIGIGLQGVPAALAAHPSPNPSQEESLRAFLRDHLGEAHFGNDETTRCVSAFVDLKDNGTQEVIVYVTGQSWCGSGGCNMLILAPQASSYKIITHTTITRPPIRVLTTKSNGWHDISVRVVGGGIIDGYDAKLSFDGKKYPSNPSVPPARRVPEEAAGKVVIPVGGEGKLLF